MAQSESSKAYVFKIFFINLAVALLLSGVLYLYMYPSLQQVEALKGELLQTSLNFEEVKEKGMTFKEFSELKQGIDSKDAYLTNVVKNISETFYNKNVRNSRGGTYDAFISSKVDFIAEQREQETHKKRTELISKIIPQYQTASIGDTEANLTDFKFINHLESLLYTFNLSSDNTIGISNVKPLVQGSTNDPKQKKENESLESNIYYIPLILNISGKKADIIDFLHYVQNVGSIYMDKGELLTFRDDTISRRFPGSGSGNIYEAQYFDIDSLKMKDYLDSSNSKVEGNLIEFIKNDQAAEKVSLELSLRFYVKGLPNYKIREFVKETTKKYDEINKKLSTELKKVSDIEADSSELVVLINKIRTMSLDLSEVGKKITDLNAGLAKTQNLEDTYKKAIDYNDRLVQIEVILNDSIEKINILNTNK